MVRTCVSGNHGCKRIGRLAAARPADKKGGRGSPYRMCLLSLVWRGFCLLLFLPEQAQAEALDDILRTTGECVTQVRAKASPSPPLPRGHMGGQRQGWGITLQLRYLPKMLVLVLALTRSHKRKQRVSVLGRQWPRQVPRYECGPCRSL